MPSHRVVQGEHLSRIARERGFIDYLLLYEHPENAELREARPNPHVLFPGDRIAIPEKQEKEESAATEKKHRYVVPVPELMLRMVFRRHDDQPLELASCELTIEDISQSVETDDQGRIEAEINSTDEFGQLAFGDHEVPFESEIPFQIGHLDPLTEQSGQAGRLRNLGYYRGEVPIRDQGAFLSAVEEFQCDHNLTVDGICGPKTQERLESVHGC